VERKGKILKKKLRTGREGGQKGHGAEKRKSLESEETGGERTKGGN